MKGLKRTTAWSVALLCALALASVAFAARPKINVLPSFTYLQAGSGTAYICVKVQGPPKTVVHVAVSGPVLGAKAKSTRIGGSGVVLVRFKTNAPAGYTFTVTGRLGTSAKATKHAEVNVPQPGQTEAKQGAFSCI